MSGTRAYAIGQDELQRRLKKLHHEKDLIVTVLDHMLKRMDLMVAHVSSLTNMNQFLCYFMDASSTMEHMYMKLFKIHVLLTEDTYVDAEQQRVPHMAITYSFHASSDQSNSQLAVLEAKDRLNCLSSSSQHASSALPHLSICDEVLGRQTSAASFALPQETAAAISSLTAAYARLASGSSLIAPTCDSSGRPPAMAANCSATPGSEMYVTSMPAATVPTATVPTANVPTATVPTATVPTATVPVATVPVATVPVATVPVGTVHAPAVPAPVVLAPAVPAPVVPAPAVPAPAVSAPAVSAPVVLPIGLTPNCTTTLCSEAYATVCTAVAPAAVAPTAVAHSSAMPPPSLAPYFGTTLYSNTYTAAMPAHTVLVPGAAMSGSVIPSPATPGPAVPGPATPGHVAPDPTIPVTFTTPLASTQAPTVAPPVHQPSAEAAGAVCGESVRPVSFDQGDAYSYEEEGDQNKWSKLGPCVSVRNIPPTPVLPAQSQGSPNWVVSDNAAAMRNFTQQKPPESASRPCTSAAAQLPSKPKPPGIPSPDAGVVGTTQDIVLSFYKTPSEFWIQLTTSANILETLLKRLQEHYSSSARRREFTLKAGMYCAAYYAEDGHWYRARILQVTPDHAKVFYVDFGNIDRVDIDCVSFLEEEFASLPAQAFCCSIKGVRSPCGPGMWTIAAVRTFRNMISRQGTKLQAYFHSQDIVTGRFIVDILSDNEDHISKNLSQEFLSLCSAERAPLPKNQQGMNFTTKRHETRPVVTMSQATSSSLTTAAAVTSSTAMPLVGTPAATTTSVYMPLPMHTGPALSTSVPPPGMFPAGMPAVSIASASTLPCRTPPTSITPISVPHRGMPLAATTSDGMAPPPPGMAPPSAGMSPPPADMAPPPSAGMAPPPAGMSPPPADMASPLSADMATPPTSRATPPTGMTPPPAGMVPLPTGMAPPLSGMAPPSDVAPRPTGMGPAPSGTAPPPTGTAPPPAGLAQYSTGTAPAPTVKALRPTTAAPAPAGMVPPRKPVATVPPATITPNAMTPAATSMAPTAMAPAAMAPAAALPGGMESHGMHPTKLPPDNLRQAGTAPPALPPALPPVTVPPAVLPEGDTFCVCLSVVFSPSDFYGQIVEKANTTAKVLEELQQELNKCGAQSEAPTEEMVNKGSFWICRYQGDKNWYRARVLDVLPGNTYVLLLFCAWRDHRTPTMSSEQDQQGMNFTTKLPETRPVVTMSQATSSPVTTTAAVASSTAIPLVITTASTTTSVYMPLPDMPTGPVLSTCVLPPGIFSAGMPTVSIASASTLPCCTPPTSTAAVSMPHLGVPLAGTPSDGMALPPTSMAPPSAGMSQPPADVAPPLSAGMALPPVGMSPPLADMAPPPSAGMAPLLSGMAPPSDVAPRPTSMGPEPADTAPPPAGMAPPLSGMAPPSDVAPRPTGMGSEPSGMAPPPADSAPLPAGMAPPLSGMAPPSDVAPRPTGMGPEPSGTTPPPADTAPPPAGMAPPLSGMAPPSDVAPHPTGMGPEPSGMAPPPADTAPPPAGMALPPASTPPTLTVKALHPTSVAPAPAATSMAPTAMAPAAMAPAAAPPGGMESHGMHPTTLPPDNLSQAGMTPPALPPATVPPAVLPEGDTFCIYLSVVFNPSEFYGHVVEEANPTVKVLEELNEKLNTCSTKSEAPTDETVIKGSFWICLFEGDKNWYRAQVLDALPGRTCRRFRVLYIDYGNRSTVLCSYLRPLPPELASLPACAHRMSLAFVCPRNGCRWDHSATAVFVKETGFDVSLVAEKKGHRRSGKKCPDKELKNESYEDTMEVVLWKRNGPTAVNINALLVEQYVALLKAAE
ncbi:uncharacterized protein LOC142578924 isoform X3 [Dermacentor variabilis]|uniref:uncharacterized protein LOC142578924 isoform X3 n=1 Tax=Dermacentor variabilis TaxID=34621 RepID=UPI003F5AFE59